MAASNLNLGKASGGVLNIQPADGTTNTSLVLPASGTVVATDVAVTDNAIARYDGTTGKLQNSGVIIDDGGNVGIGTSSPSSSLTIKDGLTLISQFGNATPRPAITSGVQKYGVHAGTSNFDDGFIRLSAGGGTGASTKSYIDISGYSSVSDMNMNIVFGCAGAERVRIGASGNVMIGTTTDNGVDKLQVAGSIALNNQIKIIPYNILGVGSITIPLPTNTISGYVTVGVSRWDTPSLSVVYFSKDVFYGHPTTVIENKINSAVSSAVLTSGSSSTLTLTFPYGTESWGNVLLTIIY